MNVLQADISVQRILLWVGLILAAVYGLAFVFMLDFVPPPPPTLSATDVVELYAHSNIKFRIGVVLMIISGAFYLPISVTVAMQMVPLEKGFPMLAVTQALASTVGAWIFAFPPVLWGVAAFTVERSPEVTVAVHQVAWLTFVTPSSFFTLQLFPIAIASLTSVPGVKHSAFPRWFGWLTIWACIMGALPTLAQIFLDGPFAWDGLFSFYVALVIYSTWIVALAFVILRALRLQQLDDTID